MNKIIVTGGSGFIGTNLVKSLIDSGFDVINLDITPPINEYRKYWKCVDLLNLNDLEKIITLFGPHYVIHLAARTDLQAKSINGYDANTKGTQNLIFVLNKITTIKRVVFTSTMLVCRPGYLPSSETDYFPSTLYGKSKVEMECLIRDTKHNYDWVIIRPTSIWGPYFKEPYYNFFALIRQQKYFHIGKSSCTKTFGYIGNMIFQIEELLHAESSQIHSKTLYLGDYEPVNIAVWANEIAAEIGNSIIAIPFVVIRFAAWVGDIFEAINIKYPLNTFRLNNMTTNNVIDLSDTIKIVPNLPYSRKQGIQITLKWLEQGKYAKY